MISLLLWLACSASPVPPAAEGAHGDAHAEHTDKHAEHTDEHAEHTDEHAEQGHKEPAGAHADDAAILIVSEDLRRDLRVSLAAATRATGSERVTALGEVEVQADALAAVSSPVHARVARVWVQEGSPVQAGQALIELESADIGHARAALLEAQATATQAAAVAARKRALGEVASGAEVEAANAEEKVAAARLRAAEAALAAYGVGVRLPSPVDGRFTLRAPLTGVVLTRDATQGAVVSEDRPLFEVGDLSRLQVEAHVFERDAVRLTPGQAVDLSFSALPGVSFSGTLAYAGAAVDAADRTIPVRIDLPADPRLRPGMAATARLEVAAVASGVQTVPAAALQRLNGGWVVFVPLDGGRYRVQAVGRGRDIGDQVEVLSGLRDGEQVVLEGAFLLKAEAEKRAGGGEGHHEH